MEEDFLLQLRSRIWPWEQAEEVTKELKAAPSVFRRLTSVLERIALIGTPQAKEELQKLATRLLDQGLVDGGAVSDSDVGTIGMSVAAASEMSRSRKVQVDMRSRLKEIASEQPESAAPVADRRPPGLWLLDHAWWIVLSITALVVVVVGYQTQFLDNTAFEGDRRDYFSLALWALAIQVAGSSILEIVGKLRPPAGPQA